MARSLKELTDEIQRRHDELDATAGESEQLGQAPPVLVELMRELRVPMVKVPTEVGGDQLTMAEQFHYFAALAYANPTAGWTGFNHAGAASIAGARLDERGLEEVFGVNPSPFFAAVSAPTGTFRRTNGGVTLTGRWKFASGVTHADWAIFTAMEQAEKPNVQLLVVPRSDFVTAGDWNVMALKGTGSIDMVCDDVAVPEHRVLDPFIPAARGGPAFQLPYPVFVAGENIGFTHGVAQRFMDEAMVYAKRKKRGMGGELAARGAFQYEIGKAQMQLHSVSALADSVLGEAWELLHANGALSQDEQNKVVATVSYGTELCAAAVSHIFHFLGASILFEENVLQRCFRDVHGSAQHLVAANTSYDAFGADLLGTEVP